jgi:redox-sensitive bicupin YhaK (pirin superfamily)
VVAASLDPARRYWLHVAAGEVALGDRVLHAGDALGFVDEGGERALRGIGASSDVLLFDLPA